MKDMKAALNSGDKPDITHVRKCTMTYIARACEYGSHKYERSNFLRTMKTDKEDFERYRSYLRAAVSHLLENLDEMEKHQSTDPSLQSIANMRKSVLAKDDSDGEESSFLPHIAHAIASLNMALAQAIDCGLLPKDPGRPWDKK